MGEEGSSDGIAEAKGKDVGGVRGLAGSVGDVPGESTLGTSAAQVGGGLLRQTCFDGPDEEWSEVIGLILLRPL